MPILSLIIPVYNVSSYIVRCMNSICIQNNPNIEILIINDETPDDSIEKILPYCKLYKNIKIVHQINKGLGGARNTGLRVAKGDYIWFIDSDDEIVKDSIEFILGHIDNEEIIIYDFHMLNNKGNLINTVHYPFSFSHLSGSDAEKHFLLTQVWRSIYKREFLLHNNILFRERFLHEDGEFNMRVMCLANDVSYIHQTIYKYYTNNKESIMNNINIKNIVDLLNYTDTMTIMIQSHTNLSKEQIKVLARYVLAAVAFGCSIVDNIPNSEMKQFRDVLSIKRKIIIQAIKTSKLNLYNSLKVIIQLYFPYKFVYNLIYRKKFL